MKNNFIQGRTFINVNDLNTQALNWSMKENSHLQKGLGVIPAEIHKTEPLIGSPAKELIMPYLAPSRAMVVSLLMASSSVSLVQETMMIMK